MSKVIDKEVVEPMPNNGTTAFIFSECIKPGFHSRLILQS
jgi:hypothetical protein